VNKKILPFICFIANNIAAFFFSTRTYSSLLPETLVLLFVSTNFEIHSHTVQVGQPCDLLGSDGFIAGTDMAVGQAPYRQKLHENKREKERGYRKKKENQPMPPLLRPSLIYEFFYI
jgi:hypothetical protein